ncbi:hypothetical protein [Kitasatospora kifunensis]|uniref:Uncharacterized protein n=1 Tax=Kitasatospora kifunensis TaxID=58351 RepID=A0A7W7VWB2_KITKI|nr:hypothetical protein [Kitasatospora kifunensis]MBB4924778.1 hypothetical protein [Kitasatospora kifunensis]
MSGATTMALTGRLRKLGLSAAVDHRDLALPVAEHTTDGHPTHAPNSQP